MDARERWQALQARLKAARAAYEAEDRAAALAEVTAALELDSEFLAAQALRDRILAMSDQPAAPALPAPPAESAPDAVGISPNGYAKFEQRARRRRVDRKIDAARAAIEQQRLKAAAIALDEVIELDPNLPELAELTATFDELRRRVATPRRGPWAVAAAVFAAALLGGSWLQDATPILSRQIVAAGLLPELTSSVAAAGHSSAMDPVATTGMREPEPTVIAAPAPAIAEVVEPHAPVPQTTIRPLAGASIEPPPPPRHISPMRCRRPPTPRRSSRHQRRSPPAPRCETMTC